MAYKTPSEISLQYREHLKSLKPEININQRDSDWYIRSQIVGGVVAGAYADNRRIANDAFPQSARREAIDKHLKTYFDGTFLEATQAEGSIQATAIVGSTIGVSTQLQYEPNGNLYVTTEAVTFDAVTATEIPVQSVGVGQDQNLLAGASLTWVSPPAGVDSTATVTGEGLIDGRNEESVEQAKTRILNRIRQPLAGGKKSDYEEFAQDADPSVVSANVIPFAFGFGSLALVITAGTTDIDEAIDNDIPVFLIPSESLIETVQEYIETQKVVTDCPVVIAPTPKEIDVTIRVRFASGGLSTIVPDLGITQEAAVIREVKRAIYKTPPGGRVFGNQGYVVASEIEEQIDINLSAEPISIGDKAQIIVDRQIEDLSVDDANIEIDGSEVAIPGTITVIDLGA